MRSQQSDRGWARACIQEAPGGGWDITSVKVRGSDMPISRKGEFASAIEAEEAAFKLAEEFAKEQGLDVR